jgi:probable HAF family extracellular repeat protein
VYSGNGGVTSSVVQDDLAFHPFLWDGRTIRELPHLGGSNGTAVAINDMGRAVGAATLTGDEQFHAVVWSNDAISDLGVLQGDEVSFAQAVNSKGQVVGGSSNIDYTNSRAFLWEDGGPMIDLNTLIPPGATLHLVVPGTINDRGEIAGFGLDFGGNSHAVLLVPWVVSGASDCHELVADGTSTASPAVLPTKPPLAPQGTPFLRLLSRGLAQGHGTRLLTHKR